MDVSVTMKSNKDEIMLNIQEAVAQALEAIGITAEAHAKEICPVDTGRLRASISHAVDGDTVVIGTNVEYAPAVELGTSRQKAKPYLRPAATQHSDEYKELATRALRGK